MQVILDFVVMRLGLKMRAFDHPARHHALKIGARPEVGPPAKHHGRNGRPCTGGNALERQLQRRWARDTGGPDSFAVIHCKANSEEPFKECPRTTDRKAAADSWPHGETGAAEFLLGPARLLDP